MSDISSEQVRSQVERFWATVTGTANDKFEDLYSSDAVVFTGSGKHSDPASLVAVRRTRQRAAAASGSTVELGPIEVQVLAPDVAVATYAYKFHSPATRGGSGVQTHAGRATQVFRRDPSGKLRILHEHLSSGAPAKTEKAREGE